MPGEYSTLKTARSPLRAGAVGGKPFAMPAGQGNAVKHFQVKAP